MHAVVDFDFVKYTVASIGENKTIKAIHPSGVEIDCKTRTELWGHYLKKGGGILAEFNKANNKHLRPEEFEIIDLVTYEPIENILHTANQMVARSIRESGATSFSGYVGKGASFRLGRSTILEYKGNRKDTEKPKFLDEVTDHIIRKYNPDVVEGLEADDWVVIDCNGRKDRVVVGVDKDYRGCNVLYYDVNRPNDGVINCMQLGELFLKSNGDVTGKGRKFFYHQILSGDGSDNYKANSANPDIKWGEKSSYKLLKDCQTDKDCFEAMKKGYQLIYPEPKKIIGWRGDELEIDWKYVFDENFDMARMLRHPTDDVLVGTDILDKFGLLEG